MSTPDRIAELIAECDAKNVCPLGLALIRQRSISGDGWSDWRHSYPHEIRQRFGVQETGETPGSLSGVMA